MSSALSDGSNFNALLEGKLDGIVTGRKFNCYPEEWEKDCITHTKNSSNMYRLLAKYGGVNFFDPDNTPYRAYVISMRKMKIVNAGKKGKRKLFQVYGVPKGLADTDENIKYFSPQSLDSDALFDMIKICPQHGIDLYDDTDCLIDQLSELKQVFGEYYEKDAAAKDHEGNEISSIPTWDDFPNFSDWPDENKIKDANVDLDHESESSSSSSDSEDEPPPSRRKKRKR